MSRFAVTAASDTVQLTDRKGDASFTVGNTGTDPDRVMAVVLVSETDTPAAQAAWFTVDDPLRTIDPNGHDQYRVSVVVPPDAAAGTYGFRLRAYSADQPPEETAETSKRVTFTIEPTAPPPKPWYKHWWIYAVVVGVLALIAVLFFLLKPDDEKAEAATFTSPAEALVPCRPPCSLPITWTDTGADRYLIELRDITGGLNTVALGETSLTTNEIVIALNFGRLYRATLTTVDGGKPVGPPATLEFTVFPSIIIDPGPGNGIREDAPTFSVPDIRENAQP